MGELLDRITILKLEAVENRGRCLPGERRSRELFESAFWRFNTRSCPEERLSTLWEGDLLEVNETLWDREDEIRACDAQGDFGPRFVELARSI